MAEEAWNEARLIPTSGINGADEQERRATSALLAVMVAVREFGRTLTHRLGAPAGRLEAYIEVPFDLGEKRYFPDGLLRVSRGARTWTALVEVKAGANRLAADQVECYLEIAREQGFESVVTVSNEIPAIAGQHPTKVDKRKLRKVSLHHLSWTQVLSEAVMQKDHRGVADTDQAWILGELIRYLEHPRSGALEFEDMGTNWVRVRDAVKAGTLRANDPGAAEVASAFDALLRFASLRLGRELGIDVVPVLSRSEVADPSTRTQALVGALESNGTLAGAIRIPDTVGPLGVAVDLRAGQVTCQVDLDAPRDGRPLTRVNWLVRQLRESPDTVRVEAHATHDRGGGTVALLRDVRDNPGLLIADTHKELRRFQIALTRPLGVKRGRGRGSFIDSVLDVIDIFYAEVMQNLRSWSATPPRLREPAELKPPEVLASTALSSQDGAETPSAGAPDTTQSEGERIVEPEPEEARPT
jgi:hypothetical protein